MKNLKLLAISMCLGFFALNTIPAQAEVGYIDYQKVLDNYSVAKQAVKEIDAKTLELQQLMVDKEKQYKSLDTPLKKQNFESQAMSELSAKQEALYRLKEAKETQIMNQVQAVAKSVMVAQKLDAILSNQVIFVGGVDVTDVIIQRLNTGK